jgi:hypothetical protein
MPINVTCPSCNQSVAAPEAMAGKKAACPNCRAVLAVPELLTAALAEPAVVDDIPASLDIAGPTQSASQAEDEKAALRLGRLVYVFFRDDWRRLLTCAHLWLVFFLFFFPWVNISCSGRTLATQTGLQTFTGGLTVDARFEKAARNDKGLQNDNLLKEQPPWSVLSAVFIVFVFFGGLVGFVCIACVFLQMSTIAKATHLFSLGLGGAAFLALAAQMTIGFPVDRHINQQIEKKRAEQDRPNAPGAHPNDAGATWVDLETRYTFWLWLSCILTFISAPAFVLEFAILIVHAIKRHAGQRDDSG